jgi:hypothetical protein
VKTTDERRQLIEVIRKFPEELTPLVQGLTQAQLIARPLPQEWSLQQIVHHLADSHMNSLIRLKLILTSERPTLIGYDQDVWGTLPDVGQTAIENSLMILKGLHVRWCAIWDSLTEEQWQRVGIHTELGPITPDDMLSIYADHCRNHLDQIRRVRAAVV